MNRIRLTGDGRLNDLIAAQIRVAHRRPANTYRFISEQGMGRQRINIRIDGYGMHSLGFRGTHYPQRDLATIGD